MERVKGKIYNNEFWRFEDFLDIPGIDPGFDKNKILKTAICYGLIDIVDILLKDKRVNPALENSLPLKIAYKYKQYEIIKLLIKDKRSNITPISFNLFLIACNNGDLEMVKLIQQYCLCDLTYLNNRCIKTAYYNNHTHIVKYLLYNSRIITTLIDQRDYEILNVVLNDPQLMLFHAFSGIKIVLNRLF